MAQLADQEEFEFKRKELEELASPIFARMYQHGGDHPAGGMPGGAHCARFNCVEAGGRVSPVGGGGLGCTLGCRKAAADLN
jgi:hypothetical protein